MHPLTNSYIHKMGIAPVFSPLHIMLPPFISFPKYKQKLVIGLYSVEFLEPETIEAPGLMTFVVITSGEVVEAIVVTLLVFSDGVIIGAIVVTLLTFTSVVIVSDIAVAGLGLPIKASIVSMTDPV